MCKVVAITVQGIVNSLCIQFGMAAYGVVYGEKSGLVPRNMVAYNCMYGWLPTIKIP